MRRKLNLVELLWGDTGVAVGAAGSSHEQAPEVPYMNICATKLLGILSVAQLGSTKARAKFSLGDAISKCLFQAWSDTTPEEIREDPNTFFFPSGKPASGYHFDWAEPIAHSEVNALVLRCAEFNGIVTDAEHAKTFTFQAVRRGVSAEVVRALRQAIGGLNMRHGRAIASNMDAAVYCPRTVLVEPGLLHVDTDGIQQAMDAYLHENLTTPAMSNVCRTCGYPDCACPKCLSVAKGSKSSVPKHNCWLQNRGRGRKSTDWIEESPEQFEARLAAWQKNGVRDVPVFKKGKFEFMA